VITVEELAKIPLFSTLGATELNYLTTAVEDIRVLPGEYTDHEGGARALYAIVSGKVELTKIINGVETVIAIRFPGELAGEVPMTLSTPLPASMRAVEPSRVIKLDAKVFYTLAAMVPQIAATVAAADLDRMEMLRKAASQPPAPQILLIGPSRDPAMHAVQTFLHRNQISFESLESGTPALAARIGEPGNVAGPYPVAQLPDGTRLVAPTLRAIAALPGVENAGAAVTLPIAGDDFASGVAESSASGAVPADFLSEPHAVSTIMDRARTGTRSAAIRMTALRLINTPPG